jgi:hypothetical protein
MYLGSQKEALFVQISSPAMSYQSSLCRHLRTASSELEVFRNWHEQNLTFSELDIFRTWHFQNLTFSELDIFRTWHFQKLSWTKFDMFRTWHAKNLKFSELVMNKNWHVQNWTCSELDMFRTWFKNLILTLRRPLFPETVATISGSSGRWTISPSSGANLMNPLQPWFTHKTELEFVTKKLTFYSFLRVNFVPYRWS